MSKRYLSWILSAALLFSGAPGEVFAAAKTAVKGVSITNIGGKKLTLKKGAVFQLKVKVNVKSKKAKYKKVSFATSDKTIVSVSSKGKLKAKKAGTAKVTVRSKVNKKKKAVVSVTVKGKGGATPIPVPIVTSKATKAPTPSQTPVSTATAEPTLVPTAEPTKEPVVTPKPDGTSSLLRRPFTDTAYVGNKLSDCPVRGGSLVDSNGAQIQGKYEWVKKDTVLEKEGKAFYQVDFVPDDKAFESIKGIEIPVQVVKKPLFLKAPKASAITTSQALSESKLSGGNALDASGKTVSGHFEWLDETAVIGRQGTQNGAVIFLPDDEKTYQKTSCYTGVRITGTSLNRLPQDKKLNLPSGGWKNNDPYERAWAGSVYDLKPLLSGLDMGRYGRVTVELKIYDKSEKQIQGNQKGFVACKLSSDEGDWGGFVSTWTTSQALLSLEGYTGGNLYLIVQNSSVDIAYIEISSVTMNEKKVSNIYDGSNLTSLYGEMFGKVGVAVVKSELASDEVMRFCKSHYNSVTIGNEMKPDYVLGGNPDLSDSNPAGYVDTKTFRYAYKDNKYPKIDFESLDTMIQNAYRHGMKMRYHVFVWHKQTPKWFFKEDFSKAASSKYVSADVMNGRLEYLIRNVMVHIYNLKDSNGVYIGREVIDSIDVANEYFHNNDGGYKSYWDEVYYPEYAYNKNSHSGIENPVYIKSAFTLANEILKEFGLRELVSLISNDYNTYMVPDSIVNMIHYFNTRDEINPDGEIICDGVGMQMHLDIGYPSVDNVQEAMEKFREAGLEIQITELDLTSYAKSEESIQKQDKYWYNLFRMILQQRGSGAKITGITWWGPDDKNSWRSDGVPLLFSDFWEAKESYFRVTQALSDYVTGEEE